ncbi:hypothetical protein RJ641_003779 [Dillenia turbinata]|uniref:Uncharacterized protein n=1 Tax=Dillenia turbinata TaxID=194707 RepID=A0AAN8ZCA2_9MAGN
MELILPRTRRMVSTLADSPPSSVTWLCFHGSYDFAYLMKILRGGDPLPETLPEFITVMAHLFGIRVYDVKQILKYCPGMHGGLERVAQSLQINRLAEIGFEQAAEGKQSWKIAKAGCIETWLATPEDQDANDASVIDTLPPDTKKALEEFVEADLKRVPWKLGHAEKIDAMQKRLVVAFRGTEQYCGYEAKIKYSGVFLANFCVFIYLRGINPESSGGDFKQDFQMIIFTYELKLM